MILRKLLVNSTTEVIKLNLQKLFSKVLNQDFSLHGKYFSIKNNRENPFKKRGNKDISLREHDKDYVLKRKPVLVPHDDFIKHLNDPSVVVIDSRNYTDSLSGFIKGSVLISMNHRYFPHRIVSLFSPYNKFLFITQPGREDEPFKSLEMVGYDKFIGYLEGGYAGFQTYAKKNNKEGCLSSVEPVDPLKVRDIANSNLYNLLDIREFLDINQRKKKGTKKKVIIPNSINIPLSKLEEKLKEIKNIMSSSSKFIGVFGRKPEDAAIACSILIKHGFNRNQIRHIGGVSRFKACDFLI